MDQLKFEHAARPRDEASSARNYDPIASCPTLQVSIELSVLLGRGLRLLYFAWRPSRPVLDAALIFKLRWSAAIKSMTGSFSRLLGGGNLAPLLLLFDAVWPRWRSCSTAASVSC